MKWYSPSQALTAKHVPYPQLTATEPTSQVFSQVLNPYWIIKISNFSIFQAARIPLTEQEVDELIWKLDQDGDGEIDYR